MGAGMKCIAAIRVDLERGPLGTRSRLADDLLGKPVLRRTAERLCQCKSISGVHLLCRVAEADRIRQLVYGLPTRIETHESGPLPYAALVRAGRAWGLDGWRG